MGRTLIVGYGNPLRGDDGLGWHAAERLAVALRETEVEIMTCHQLIPELAEPISRATLVVFIDAAQQGQAGTLSCQPITPEISPHFAFSHYLTPRTLLAWAQELYGSCPEAVVFSVSSGSFDCGEELSPPIVSALPELIERIRALVAGPKSRRASSAGPKT
jgi:hydrogenase maturation protease